MENNESHKIIEQALKIVAYHYGEVQGFIEHGFEAKDQDLLIAQKLLIKLSEAYKILKNSSQSIDQELKVLYEVPSAFEIANREKNGNPVDKFKVDEHDVRSDKWWSFFLTEAGEKTLNEIILGFMQEDQKKLSELSAELQKNQKKIEL